ncbi:hypothetical protein [Streptomyces sp. WG-D5]
MSESGPSPLHALPDGEAELAVVLRLTWEDVATLGQEASRLAARAQRTVTLDEAVSHRLRSRPPASHAKPPQAVVAAPVPASNGRSTGEQARQALEKSAGRPSPESG